MVPAGLLAMALLIGAAMVWDCSRLARDARERVDLADAEMRKQEERLAGIVAGSGGIPPRVEAALAAYGEAEGRAARHEAYENLAAACRGDLAPRLDPTHPLDRKLMDEIAGAINRREVAEETYSAELAAYRKFRGGVCGKVVGRVVPDCCGGGTIPD